MDTSMNAEELDVPGSTEPVARSIRAASTTCTCDATRTGWGCTIHVRCDEACQALEEPVTLDEYAATLLHYKEHCCMGGCSHGC